MMMMMKDDPLKGPRQNNVLDSWTRLVAAVLLYGDSTEFYHFYRDYIVAILILYFQFL
jgi:hypothetical protein